MYKPNFCSECGTEIVREHWHFWTSRKFCDRCARRFRRTRILLPVVAGAALFGVGLAAGRVARSTVPPPLVVERSQITPLVPASITKPGAQTTSETDADASAALPTPKPEPSYGPDGTASERPTDPTEIVSICGARTQRGTPCSRRVRGTGRCWQHRGMPAMLPPSKLIVQG